MPTPRRFRDPDRGGVPSESNFVGGSPVALNRKKKRLANLYDAVAGHVRTNEPLTPANPSSGSVGPRYASSQRDPSLAPDEVLFRRRRAPPRFAEKDLYFANEDLPDGGRGVLPESDLLKSIHAYSSRFYEALDRKEAPSIQRRGLVDERSMDETALLAMGVILEEAARDSLGKRGDLVFTEGIIDSQGGGNRGAGGGVENEEISAGSMSEASQRHRKRRKLDSDEAKGDDESS